MTNYSETGAEQQGMKIKRQLTNCPLQKYLLYKINLQVGKGVQYLPIRVDFKLDRTSYNPERIWSTLMRADGLFYSKSQKKRKEVFPQSPICLLQTARKQKSKEDIQNNNH